MMKNKDMKKIDDAVLEEIIGGAETEKDSVAKPGEDKDGPKPELPPIPGPTPFPPIRNN